MSQEADAFQYACPHCNIAKRGYAVARADGGIKAVPQPEEHALVLCDTCGDWMSWDAASKRMVEADPAAIVTMLENMTAGEREGLLFVRAVVQRTVRALHAKAERAQLDD